MGRSKLKTLKSDQIDLSRLPTQKIADKVRRIMDAIAAGTCYTSFKGKRMRYDRSVISIPVNREYRIIYDKCSNGIFPRTVMSHESYNGTKPAS